MDLFQSKALAAYLAASEPDYVVKRDKRGLFYVFCTTSAHPVEFEYRTVANAANAISGRAPIKGE